MMMARDICQYGHVDNFCLHNIVKCRNSIGTGLDGTLNDDDIDTFNAYLKGIISKQHVEIQTGKTSTIKLLDTGVAKN